MGYGFVTPSISLPQRFSSQGSRPKCGSPRLRGWVAKACQLLYAKEKDFRTQDFKSEDQWRAVRACKSCVA